MMTTSPSRIPGRGPERRRLRTSRRLWDLKYHGCDHAGHAQAGDQGGSLAVAMREAHPQPLAFRATTVATGHIGRSPGFGDEDQALRFKIELTLEPVMTLLQDIGSILLYRMACLFLRLSPRRTKKRCSPATETSMPLSASARRSSSRVMSLRSSQMARMSAARSSIRRERISPPRGFGAMSPVSRCCARQRTAVEGATPNRSAAARQLDPLSTAAKSRVRKSIERAIHAGLLHQHEF